MREAHGNRQIRDYCSQMVTRFQALEDRREYEFLRHEAVGAVAGDGELDFLARLVGLTGKGAGHTKANQIIIIDE